MLPPVPANRYIAFFSIAVIGLAIDLLTKQIMFAWLGPPLGSTLVPQARNPALGFNHEYLLLGKDLGLHAGFQTACNPGALFGMGAGYWWLFSILSVVAAAGIITWLFIYRAAHDRWLTIALGCVMAGIFGNLYDRIGLWDASGLQPAYEHCVRDWILVRYGYVGETGAMKYHTWPNFNIADCLLVCGAAMLVVHAWFGPRSPETQSPQTQPPASANTKNPETSPV